MSNLYRFGPIEVRRLERQLLIEGRRVPLGARSFDLLLALAERRGELATKQQLLAQVWPGLVVEEANIPVRISELRKLLGADSIATVPGLGYRLTLTADAASGSPSSGPTVAVLAFDGFSAGAQAQALGEGFADDLITELARQPGMTVLARHTSFSLAQPKLGAAVTASAIAQRLGVRYLVEGSVRRVNDEFVVNVQLIDGDGYHVWADRYAFGAQEVYVVQQRIIERIASALSSGIRVSETAASLRKPPNSLDVYELTLRGAAHERMQTAEGVRLGREELQRAIALDPGHAPAHVWLGYLNATDASAGLTGLLDMDDLPAAIAQIRRGIELDPTLALGYQALGFALGNSHEALDESLDAAQRAVELCRGDADNQIFLSRAQLLTGAYAEALASANRAIELNPMAPPLYQVQRTRVLYALDRFGDASAAARAVLLTEPGSRIARLFGAAANMARGKTDAARALVDGLLAQHPGFTLESPVLQPYFVRDAERRCRWLAQLRAAGLPTSIPCGPEAGRGDRLGANREGSEP